MFDIIYILIGAAFLGGCVLYAIACDHLWGHCHDPRLCAGRDRDDRPAGLSRLCPGPPGEVL